MVLRRPLQTRARGASRHLCSAVAAAAAVASPRHHHQRRCYCWSDAWVPPPDDHWRWWHCYHYL